MATPIATGISTNARARRSGPGSSRPSTRSSFHEARREREHEDTAITAAAYASQRIWCRLVVGASAAYRTTRLRHGTDHEERRREQQETEDVEDRPSASMPIGFSTSG